MIPGASYHLQMNMDTKIYQAINGLVAEISVLFTYLEEMQLNSQTVF